MWPCFLSYHVHATSTYFSQHIFSPHVVCFLPPPRSPPPVLQWKYILVSSHVYLVYLGTVPVCVPFFLPGNSYCWCFWMQEKTNAGHLIKSLLVIGNLWSCHRNLPHRLTARWASEVFICAYKHLPPDWIFDYFLSFVGPLTLCFSS